MSIAEHICLFQAHGSLRCPSIFLARYRKRKNMTIEFLVQVSDFLLLTWPPNLRLGPSLHLRPTGPGPLVNPGGYQPAMGCKTNKMASHYILWHNQLADYYTN